jgi:hypothetical protein
MRRSITIALSYLALLFVALALSDCGIADSHTTFLPQAFRAPEPPPLQVDTPDVRALVQADPNGLFLQSANPTNIRISQALPAVPGVSWTACVKANVMGMSGNPINDQVLQIEISGGQIRDRRRADPNGPCMYAVYEPL